MICLRLWRGFLPGLLNGLQAGVLAPVPARVVPLGIAGLLASPATLPSALLLGLLALAGPLTPSASAAATNRSHARHITPALTPLHYTERSVATPHGGKKAGKPETSGGKSVAKHNSGAGETRSAVRARTRGTTSAPHPAGKHGGKHHLEPDYDPPVPMLRAGHGKSHGLTHTTTQVATQLAWAKAHAHSHASAEIRTSTSHGRRIPLPAPDPAVDSPGDPAVAEVTGRSAHGDTLARLHRPSAGYGEGTVVVATAPLARTGNPPSAPAPIERRIPQPTATAAYDSGTAAPDSPNQYAREQSAPDHYIPPARRNTLSAAPNAPASITAGATTPDAAPNRRPGSSAPPAQVVGGFGSELALAPALPAATPGITRRRNHPLAGLPLSEDTRSSAPAVLAANLPSTLAERDAITAGAMAPSVLSPNLPNIYDSDGHLVVPAPLRGSREVLVHQNTMADNDGLERIANDAQLNHLRATGQLVDLPAGASLRVNDNLPYNRRTARPWTALFTKDISRDFYNRFHQPLWVTSAVRTVAFQSRLIRVNGNAAGLSGDFASPHLTGQAVDFGKHGMNAAQLAWMRSYLLPLIQSGKIDVEEEFQQACFHISVYRRYAGGRHLTSQTMQVASQVTSPAYVPAPPPRTASPRPVTPLTNPEMTDTEE